MKKRMAAIISVFIAILMLTSIPFVSYASSITLEKYIKNDKEAYRVIKNEAKAYGVKIKFKGNTVIYTYDLKGKFSKKQAFSACMKKAIKKALKKNKKEYTGECKKLRKKTGIKGIKIVVQYTYKGKKIVSRTFK